MLLKEPKAYPHCKKSLDKSVAKDKSSCLNFNLNKERESLMDKIELYIKQRYVKYMRLADSLIKDKQSPTKAFDNLTEDEQAIIKLYNDRADRYNQLLQVQKSLKLAKKYDVRSMSIIEIIKVKLGYV